MGPKDSPDAGATPAVLGSRVERGPLIPHPAIHGPKLEAWTAVLRASTIVGRELEQELQAEAGLSMSEYEVLLQLRYAPEGVLAMQALAESVLLSKSGITRLIDRLEEEGAVERTACQSDRRITWAGITTKGRRRLRAASKVHLRGIDEHFSKALSEKEARELERLLAKVLEAPT